MAIVGAAWHVAEHADPACVAFTETLRLVGSDAASTMATALRLASNAPIRIFGATQRRQCGNMVAPVVVSSRRGAHLACSGGAGGGCALLRHRRLGNPRILVVGIMVHSSQSTRRWRRSVRRVCSVCLRGSWRRWLHKIPEAWKRTHSLLQTLGGLCGQQCRTPSDRDRSRRLGCVGWQGLLGQNNADLPGNTRFFSNLHGGRPHQLRAI